MFGSGFWKAHDWAKRLEQGFKADCSFVVLWEYVGVFSCGTKGLYLDYHVTSCVVSIGQVETDRVLNRPRSCWSPLQGLKGIGIEGPGLGLISAGTN